ATLRLSARISTSSAVGGVIAFLSRESEAVLLPRAARPGGPQVVEKRLCRRRLARGGYGRRVDDRRMARCRKPVDDADAFVGIRVGRIDDAERRFAAGHERERRAHVLGARDLPLDAAPYAELLERRLAVLAR